MAERKTRKLYSPATERAFKKRYGRRGEEVYGRVIYKVASEQAAKSPRGVKVEHVRGHTATNAAGTTYRVEAHEVRIHAESHGRGHHRGRCTAACRHGIVAHRHPTSRRWSGTMRG